MKSFIIGLSLLVSAVSFADVVEFHIADGTQGGAWNTQETPIVAKLGDTIRFYNDDSIKHRLHTFGAPCNHGPDFAPGTTWDCVVSKSFSSESEGALYDHNFGEDAAVWIEIEE